jgi:hypothetical protein
MPAECFRITLDLVSVEMTREELLKRGFKRRSSPDDDRLEYVNREFVIEVCELGERSIWIEFAHKNNEAVVPYFFDLVDQLWSVVSHASIDTSIDKHGLEFEVTELEIFKARCAKEISVLKKIWVDTFGPELGPTAIRNAYDNFLSRQK